MMMAVMGPAYEFRQLTDCMTMGDIQLAFVIGLALGAALMALLVKLTR